jgi:aspartate racemase
MNYMSKNAVHPGGMRARGEKSMKLIGLIGGMSWVSTVDYYRIMNQMVADKLGGMHSAPIVLYSVEFYDVELAQRENRWGDAARILAGAASALERAGADFLVLCTNTMHKVAEEIEKETKLKLLHIGDVTGQAILDKGLKTVGLLGSRFTMEEEFYRKRLEDRFGLRVLTPSSEEIEVVHRIIVDELCQEKIDETSRAVYIGIIDKLIERGAEGIILGCTEIPLLIKQEHVTCPVFDTTALHAEAAVSLALS